MVNMKIVVVGLGSMGKRRIRLLKEIAPELALIGIDSNEARRQEAEEMFHIATEANLSAAAAGAHAAIVCTAPLSHAVIIGECLALGLHVFTEINLVADGYNENIRLAKEKGLKLFLSSTFLYRGETNYLINAVHEQKTPLHYQYHVGQYLPDWHPWESYKDFFVANPRTNACREIFAIDLPWILAAFGPVERCISVKGSISGLDLPYPDGYLVTLIHKNGHKGTFSADVAARAGGRRFEAVGNGIQLEWQGTPDSLRVFDVVEKKWTSVRAYEQVSQDKKYAGFIVENAYEVELRTFLSYLTSDNKPCYTFEDDLATLALIDEIEAVEDEL